MVPILEKSGKQIVAKVGCVYHFELRQKKGTPATIISLDLKNGNGKMTIGKEGRPDSTFIMQDSDFVKLT